MARILMHSRVVWFSIALVLCLALVVCPADAVLAGLLDPQDFSSLGTLNLASGDFTFDTDALTIVDDTAPGTPLFTGVVDDQDGMASPGVVPEISVFTFDDISLASSANITVVGTRALALLSQGDAIIETAIGLSGGDATASFNGSGTPGVGGSGGYSGGAKHESGVGPGGGLVADMFPVWGGGGGFGSEGDDGQAGRAGSTYGDLSGLLQGGSGGGGTIDPSPTAGAAGGGGGGAVEIGAAGSLSITNGGGIVASGGRGGAEYVGLVSEEFGGSGSGGGIRLHATQIILDETAAIAAKGGLLPIGGGAAGGAGRVLFSGITSLPFAVGISTIDPGFVTAQVDVSGGHSGLVQGVVTVAPPLVLVPNGQSVSFGQASVIQAASTSQPAVELFVTNDVQIMAGGEATVPTGGFTNHNVIELQGGNARITGSDPLTNLRLIEGAGSIETTVLNGEGANLSVSVEEQLTITGSGNTNDGDISVVAGSLEYTQDLTNNAGGRINAINAELTFTGGLTNDGELNLINSTVSGTVSSSSAIALSGSNTFSGAVSGPGNFTGDGEVVFNGSYAPGASPAEIAFGGDLALGSSNTLFIELAGTALGQFDRLTVAGDLALDGILDVATLDFDPADGSLFEILNVGGELSGTFMDLPQGALVGTFDSTDLFITYEAGNGNDVALFAPPAGLAGDYNGNGVVDAADYAVWRDTLGSTTVLDANGDDTGASQGIIDEADFAVWRAHFGETLGSGSGAGALAAVPEPATSLLLPLGVLVWLIAGRRGDPRRPSC